MTKTQTTKRALIASVLSLLVCFSMLIGSTFAWFSDTATTNVNTIQAGNLKIDLGTLNGETFTSVKDSTIDFIKADNTTTILWEPGCTYALPDLYVKNMGNLAFKYKVIITGINGDAKLNEAIEWTIDYGYEGHEGYMLGDATLSAPIKIFGHMKEDAGNGYQGLSIEGVSITVVATQYSSEYDSFNNTYDENADGTPDAPNYVNVNTTAELKDAFTNAAANDVIVLNSGKYEIDETVKTNGSLEIQDGADVTLVLGDNKISTNVSADVNVPTIVNNGTLTIEGGTISNKNATAGNTNVAAIYNASGELTLKDCTIENTAPTSGGDYAVVVAGGKVVLDNCKVVGGRGGIAVTGGTLEMNGGSVSASVYYPVYLVDEASATFNNVSLTKQNNSKGKALIYNALTSGTATFTSCTFESKIASTTKLEFNNTFTNLTFTTCTYTNVSEPNA